MGTAWPMFEQTPVCSAILCGIATHVVDHVCTPCPEGENNTAGDDSSGANTVCDGYLTNTLVIFLQLSGVYEFNPVVELAMTDSISNVLATEDIIAEVGLNNDTKIVNETTGEFAAEFFIFVQSQTSEDPQEVLTTNFVRGEFQQALMAEFEENDLGFTMSNFALREEPAAMEASEKTRAETVMMIILIFVVGGMGAFLFKLMCLKEEKRLQPENLPMGRMNTLQGEYSVANQQSSASLPSSRETTPLAQGDATSSNLGRGNSFQM